MGELDEKLNAILNDPGAMGQIMALAQSLGGSAPQSEETPSPCMSQPREQCSAGDSPDLFSLLDQADPRLIRLGMRVLQEYRKGDDRKTALLAALRPFVREERYGKLDRAIQIAKLSRVIRVLFQAMGEESGEDV